MVLAHLSRFTSPRSEFLSRPDINNKFKELVEVRFARLLRRDRRRIYNEPGRIKKIRRLFWLPTADSRNYYCQIQPVQRARF